MKKVTVLAAAIATLGLFATEASAQTTTPQTAAQQGQTQGQEEKKEKVTQDQLPEPVKAALKSDTYKDWTVGEIYKVAPAEGQAGAVAVYEVMLTNAQGQQGSIRIDEKGADASAK
ncbi:hypothetical protein [Pontibacter akesuensis]|uniref:Peptidase propeptide and YPEB domain-containing protein n=1 Tax=Pontibacter akesuensis TaxID=388950 RepID=A0A1I7KQX9_9BACT|nr:hypothetical protein [Pontibacter akesuensis]GHA81298.1 hypothetical protein GCM10007389_39770 [Pontibacter akesuensis]SFU99774.1 hypothetical protein SAMN04487941_4001 [Pontibacter akesuensis]